MTDYLSEQALVERLDRINRERSLEDHESAALERAIRRGEVSHREAARLGLKRDMRIFLK